VMVYCGTVGSALASTRNAGSAAAQRVERSGAMGSLATMTCVFIDCAVYRGGTRGASDAPLATNLPGDVVSNA